MAISGTYSFNPEIGDIVEEAFERAGLELRSGFDLRSARRSINFLTLEWQNRGINLWTIEEKFLDTAEDGTALTTNFLIQDTASYRLAAGTISVLDMVLRTNDGGVTTQSDYALNRISEPTYATIPNKLSSSRPLQFYLERKEILNVSSFSDGTCDTTVSATVTMDSTANVSAGMVVTGTGIVAEGGTDVATTVASVTNGTTLVLSQNATAINNNVTLTFTTNQHDIVTFWPRPDSSTKYKVIYWRMKRIADAGDNAGNTMGIPSRFQPALVSGLAYHIACKRPEAASRIQMLKQQYEEVFSQAADEDRVKTSARFVPRIPSY